MYYKKSIMLFNFGQGQQVTNILKVIVQQCRNVQKSCWVCVLRYQRKYAVRARVSAGPFVSGLILVFICSALFSVCAWILWTKYVCVSHPAQLNLLGCV